MKEETTKHVLSCSKMPPPHQLKQDDLYDVEDIGFCRKVIELYSCNDRLRNDCEVQKSSENSTFTGIE